MSPMNNLGYLIQHLAAVMGRQSDQVLQEQLGIGLSQFKILMVLEWNPRVQQNAIADALGQTEASVSRQIKLLKGKKLLEIRQDPQNRRRHITVPTPLGMQMTEAATAIMRRNFGSEFAGLGEDQLMQLAAGLQQLHKVVCRPGKLGACDHQLGL
ncbi:MAG TPA: MarR family winged helix-turn-helix transcriptional regulator [Candidatus Saccharimonadales bacterium]|jgi:DNA-binding MarR family transcriptional regulator|nr:MarR family winged helix-turn-helix transcriptional regulator [Candidatus Saccharimonadales bacterium]